MKNLIKGLVVVLLPLILVSCSSQKKELKSVEYIDISKFMGDWYVIANIPTFLEKNIFNAIENYELNTDGTVKTTFSYNAGNFDGPRKSFSPRGFIANDGSNAVWGMQFIWPIKADYRVIYIAPDYSYTIIGRNKRDFVWLMSRSPSMPEADIAFAKEFISKAGYDINDLLFVPQQW